MDLNLMSEIFGTREGQYYGMHEENDIDRDCTEKHCCTTTGYENFMCR